MKISQILMVDGRRLPLVSLSLTVERDVPGRGIAAVIADSPLQGRIEFFAGIDGATSCYFTGYIENSLQIDATQQRITFREHRGRLARRIPIALRNVTLKEAIAELERLSNVRFITAGKWITTPVAHFINLGSGDEAVRLIGQLSGIDDFIAAGQCGGSVYLGSAGELKYTRKTLVFDPAAFSEFSATGADTAFLPALRPGMRLRIGNAKERTIASINLAGEKMRINWEDHES